MQTTYQGLGAFDSIVNPIGESILVELLRQSGENLPDGAQVIGRMRRARPGARGRHVVPFGASGHVLSPGVGFAAQQTSESPHRRMPGGKSNGSYGSRSRPGQCIRFSG